MKDHAFGMSRNMNRNVAARVHEKYIAAKTRELFIVSQYLSIFMKYKRI
jgi:hypothetical protein